MELVSTCMVVLEAPFPNTSTNSGMLNGARPNQTAAEAVNASN